MGKIEFANCQDVRNQKKIQELDCPRCHSSRRNRTGGSGVRSI